MPVVVDCGVAPGLSNLMVALAVGERLREDRSESLRARNELMAHYLLTPVGMFTLNESGVFQRISPMLSRMLNIEADPSENTIYWTDFFPEQDWKAVAQSTQNGQDVTITGGSAGGEAA